MVMPDWTVKAIGLHDFGLDGPGANKILVNHYNQREKVEELLNLGTLLSLGPQIDHDPNMFLPSRNIPLTNVTVAYHRDYGDPYTPPVTFESELHYYANAWDVFGAEFIFLFEDGSWFETCIYKGELLNWIKI